MSVLQLKRNAWCFLQLYCVEILVGAFSPHFSWALAFPGGCLRSPVGFGCSAPNLHTQYFLLSFCAGAFLFPPFPLSLYVLFTSDTSLLACIWCIWRCSFLLIPALFFLTPELQIFFSTPLKSQYVLKEMAKNFITFLWWCKPFPFYSRSKCQLKYSLSLIVRVGSK